MLLVTFPYQILGVKTVRNVQNDQQMTEIRSKAKRDDISEGVTSI